MTHPLFDKQATACRTLLPSLATALILAACGNSGSNTSAPPTSVTGQVVDGPIKGATVKAFELKSDNTVGATALATGITGADGSYRLTLPGTFSGNVTIIATGGTYCAGSATAQVANDNTCPAGTLTTLEVPLLTVATATAGAETGNAHVTPVSTAALPPTATLDAATGSVSGTLSKTEFEANFGAVSGGKSPGDTPAGGLAELLAQINKLQSASGGGQPLSLVIGSLKSGAVVTAVANESATASQASFSIKKGGPNASSMMPEGAQNPSVLVGADGSAKSTTAASTNSPYFQERTGIDIATLQTIMGDTSVVDVNDGGAPYYSEIHVPVTVTIGSDSYKGYRLADVIVRATQFRPADGVGLPGVFGAATAVVAFGAKPDGSTGRVAAFSFTELIRTENGNKTIVAYEKNGGPLPASEGALAIIPGNDDDKLLRKVARLKEIHVRNDYVATSHTLNNTDAAAAAFQVTGQVVTPTTITTGALSATSSQAYYAVDKVGEKSVSDFKTYYFREYGPRHMNYWWGQGIRLADVLDTAGLTYPGDKGACFVVVTSANNLAALFSCGELYNSPVGRGDGLEGSANRSRYKGVLLVTDDFRSGGGNNVMMTCWDYESCVVNNGGEAASYTAALNTGGNQVNKQMIALVSTQDYLPFQVQGRWFPYNKTAAGANSCTGPTNCIPWVDVGERLQQNIKTMTVYYAAGVGNGTPSAGNGGGSGGTGGGSGSGSGGGAGSVCGHDQVMGGQCVKADMTTLCDHLDWMAGTTCYLKP